MNERLFQLLKQAYSSLGLGDSLLKAYADNLAAYATEENIETIVAAQKGTLEAIQKANDKRAGDAASKAKAEAEQAQKLVQAMYEQQKAELEKQLEELKKKAADKNEPPKPDDDQKSVIPDWFTAEQKKVAEQMAALLENNKTLTASLAEIKKNNEERDAKVAKEEREKFISKTARELGIPDWREKEGFNITDTMSEDDIKNYLSGVSNNIRTNVVGHNRLVVPQLEKNKEEMKESAKRVATTLVDQM